MAEIFADLFLMSMMAWFISILVASVESVVPMSGCAFWRKFRLTIVGFCHTACMVSSLVMSFLLTLVLGMLLTRGGLPMEAYVLAAWIPFLGLAVGADRIFCAVAYRYAFGDGFSIRIKWPY